MRRTRSHSRPTFDGGSRGRGSRVHRGSNAVSVAASAAGADLSVLGVGRLSRGSVMATPLCVRGTRRVVPWAPRLVPGDEASGLNQIPSSPSFAESSSGDGAEATFALQCALSQISIVSMTPMMITSRVMPARCRRPCGMRMRP